MKHRIDIAVADRFAEIRPSFTERTGDYIYSGYRCQPQQIGWRLRQNLSIRRNEPDAGLGWNGYPGILRAIAAGEHDSDIENTWHDAASAEHWYRFEKDYGTDEPRRNSDAGAYTPQR